MIAIIDYGAGNLTSVKLALDALHATAEVTRSADRILAAERVIFPGVGAAGAAMQNLRQMGLIEAIRAVIARGTPFLGICVGTQVMFEFSEEDGGTPCMGLISGQVKLFHPASRYDKVPQIGWNSVSLRRPHPVLSGIDSGSEFYFVHSYYPAPSGKEVIVGETEYADAKFASIVADRSLVATQFHPEKSGRRGLKLLGNFLRWDGKA